MRAPHRGGGRGRIRRLGWTLGLVLIGLASGAPAATFDYLYVEANEGGSSGGHVALRFADEVYHFQHLPGGLLKLRRDDLAAFHVRYALIENRTIHVRRVTVSDPTAAGLRDAFARRLQIEAVHHDRLAALRADVALFARWQRRARGLPVSVPIRAAGYFELPLPFESAPVSPHVPAGAQPSTGAVARLRAEIARRHGADFIDRRRAAVRAELAGMQLRAARAAGTIALDEYPHVEPTASTRYAEALERLSALDVLAAAPPLRADAVRQPGAAPPLDEPERRSLTDRAERLAADLAALPASPRPDWGYPLLLGMARLAAIDASLASGRLVILDRTPADAPAPPLPRGALRAPFFAALAEQTAAAAARQRSEFFAQPRWREADYTALEAALNLQHAVEAARAGAPLRHDPTAALPNRPAPRVEWDVPPGAVAAGGAELEAARGAAAAYAARLAQVYGYNLVARNCVSELFAVIGATPGAPAGLGGVVRTRGTWNFIPFLSADAVERGYAAVDRDQWPSFRRRRLAALRAAESTWRVWLRESNTLTATAYRPGPHDSSFLFFTDQVAPARPLLGAANLLYALGDGAVGLASAPGDGGARLGRAARGALYSLPELVFVNLRKGTTAFVTAAEVDAALSETR